MCTLQSEHCSFGCSYHTFLPLTSAPATENYASEVSTLGTLAGGANLLAVQRAGLTVEVPPIRSRLMTSTPGKYVREKILSRDSPVPRVASRPNFFGFREGRRRDRFRPGSNAHCSFKNGECANARPPGGGGVRGAKFMGSACERHADGPPSGTGGVCVGLGGVRFNQPCTSFAG